MEELERTKKALGRVMTVIRSWGLDYAYVVEPLEGEINSILNPPPEMETVEVVRWATVDADGWFLNSFEKEDQAKLYATPGQITKLTGTYQRPRPQKVERSVSVVFGCDGGKRTDGGNWSELIGKRGIFVYSE